MKTLLCFITVAFIGKLNCLSQTKEYLDKRNGIQDFSIGDPFEKWKSDLELLNKENNAYKYTGNCCRNLFERTVANILLMFEHNKIVGIVFSTSDLAQYNKNGYYEFQYGKYVEDKLIGLFGKADRVDSSDDNEGSHYRFFWSTEKLCLTVSVTYGGILDGKLTANFTLLDSKYSMEKFGREF